MMSEITYPSSRKHFSITDRKGLAWHTDLLPGGESDEIDHKKCTSLFLEYILFFLFQGEHYDCKASQLEYPIG